jgi:AraC-like DNA-binding protein/quercetin dioxygenase-like cupin family protein
LRTVHNRQTMVNMGQNAIRQVGYNPPPGKAGEVEVETIQGLLNRAGYDEFRTTQRLDFHFMLAVTSGRTTHMVDFTDHALRPGAVLWIRPGQVQRWGDLSSFDGYSLAFPPGLLDPETDALAAVETAYGSRYWTLTPRQRTVVAPLLDSLFELSPDQTLAPDLRRAALTHLLATLLLRLRGLVGAEAASDGLPEAYVAFRDLVESEHARQHSVTAYAATLGYSSRTLVRATQTAVGVSPKRVIDDRILLEARRLLAHTDQTVARIGTSLGFEDASNFTSWFEKRAGMLPSDFRRVFAARSGFGGSSGTTSRGSGRAAPGSASRTSPSHRGARPAR